MRKIYLATAILAFFCALVTQLPARLAWQWWGTDAMQSGVVVAGIEGTLFEGTASGLYFQALQVMQPRWRGHFWPLLTWRMRFDIDGSLDDYPLHTRLTLGPGNRARFKDLQLALPASRIAPLLQLPVMPLAGMVSTDIQNLKFRHDRVTRATGRIELRNAEWLLVRPPIKLGNLQADISTDEDIITAELGSEGPLQMQGQVRLLADGSYQADIRLRAGTEAGERLGNLLRTLGQPVEGWHLFKSQGRLYEPQPGQGDSDEES